MQPQQNNYDFIMNPGQPGKKAPLGNDNSMMKRIIIVVGGLVVLVIIAAVLVSFLGNAGKQFNEAAVLSVAQDQSEIVRLADSGVENGVSASIKNFAITTKLGLKSEQTKLLEYTASAGYEVNAEQLALKQNAQTDSQLEAAVSSSTFDETYTTVMQRQLQTYQSDLKAAYEGASPAAQQVLSARYDTSELLLAQLSGNQ